MSECVTAANGVHIDTWVHCKNCAHHHCQRCRSCVRCGCENWSKGKR